MVRAILTVAGFVATAMCAYHFGQEEVELRWAQDREHSLIQQIENLQKKDREIANLKQSISVLNDSAVRVRSRDVEIQRRLQTELRECGRFKRAFELSSAALNRCAERAVSDRGIIEWCAIQLRR